MTDSYHLFVTLHPIVVVEELDDGVGLAIRLWRQMYGRDQVTSPVLAHLDSAVIESNGQAILAIYIKVETCEGGDLGRLRLLP